MIRVTDSEWNVLEVLWQSEGLTLGQVLDGLFAKTGWSRTTVHTYLTRMMAKGLVEPREVLCSSQNEQQLQTPATLSDVLRSTVIESYEDTSAMAARRFYNKCWGQARLA